MWKVCVVLSVWWLGLFTEVTVAAQNLRFSETLVTSLVVEQYASFCVLQLLLSIFLYLLVGLFLYLFYGRMRSYSLTYVGTRAEEDYWVDMEYELYVSASDRIEPTMAEAVLDWDALQSLGTLR